MLNWARLRAGPKQFRAGLSFRWPTRVARGWARRGGACEKNRTNKPRCRATFRAVADKI